MFKIATFLTTPDWHTLFYGEVELISGKDESKLWKLAERLQSVIDAEIKRALITDFQENDNV